MKSDQQNLFSFEHANENPPSLIKQKKLSHIWSCVFSIEMKQPNTFREIWFSVSSWKQSIMYFQSKKQTGNLFIRQEKYTGSKVAAFYSCNVAIMNNKLELLDAACNFTKKDFGTHADWRNF